MSKQPTNHDPASMAGQLQSLADQMTVLIDEAMNLENACGWYHNDDPQYGGLPTVDQLKISAMRLRTAYMNMALTMGLDPCEQLPSTKARLKRARMKRAREKLEHIDFDN